jgi:exonuclease SbcD
MQIIKGSLAEIEKQLAQFEGGDPAKPVWLDIEVATQDYLSDIQRRVQALTADLPVEVVLLRRSKEQRINRIEQQEKETLSELSVSDVFERRLALEPDPDEPRQARMRTLFAQVVEQVTSGQNAEDSAQ